MTQNKVDLIEKFKIILGKCKSIFKSNCYDFWLAQLGSIPYIEIPITKFGLSEATRLTLSLSDSNQHSCKDGILDICENLFTYSHSEDTCPFQTQYHYYFLISDSKVFKESKMGITNLKKDNIYTSNIRIATISEIKADSSEYIQ